MNIQRWQVCLVLSVFLTMVFSGCITNQASALSSLSMEASAVPVNPALSLPGRGLHPYVSADYSDKQGYQASRDSIEDAKSGRFTVGFNWHDSMEEEVVAIPFVGAYLSGAALSYQPRFTDGEIAAIDAEGIDVDQDLVDYSAELGLKSGLLLRYRWLLVSPYFQGMLKYEDGSYASLRQRVDGIGSLYNLVDNPWTYGYSLGVDVQGGSADTWDVGVNLTIAAVFNETQSVSWDYINDYGRSPFSDGSDSYRSSIVSFGPYFDYRHVRFSIAIIEFSSVSTQLAWRF